MAEQAAATPISGNGIIPMMAEGAAHNQPVENQEVIPAVQEAAAQEAAVQEAVAPPAAENVIVNEVPGADAAGASGPPDVVAGSSDSTPEKVTPPAANAATAASPATAAASPAKPDYKAASSVYEFTVKDASGNDVSMEKYKGNVLLIVNIASKCGYTTSNNRELTELKEKYESRGLRILAFPCNQFMGQEPGTSEEIACFLAKKKADFGDVFAKCEVNGTNSIPLYKYLKHKLSGTMGNFIKWNYTKFIVDKNGQPVERHGPNVSPNSLVPNIERYL